MLIIIFVSIIISLMMVVVVCEWRETSWDDANFEFNWKLISQLQAVWIFKHQIWWLRN